MKKIVISCALLVFTLQIQAQKEELKTLKKLYAIEKYTADDIVKYKEATSKLKEVAVSPEDKNSATFYNAMTPLLELNSLGEKPNPMQVMKIFNPANLEIVSSGLSSVLEFEKQTGKSVYSTDIKETLTWFKPMLQQIAFTLNDSKKFKEAGSIFYSLYQLEKTNNGHLENAAILAAQAQDYILAEKLYREIQKIGFKGTGTQAFINTKPADCAKMIAVLAVQNGNKKQAIDDYTTAIDLNPNELEMQIAQAGLYYELGDVETYKTKIHSILQKNPNNAQLQYNIGYLKIENDSKLVEEINANLKNAKKYEELNSKRKAVFNEALPYFEKAYQLDVNNQDYKTILKSTYEILGMKDKASMVK